MKIKKPFLLLVSIIIAQFTGAIGTFFTVNSIPSWYNLLEKPSFSPPNWVFGPVWTILYTLIGISLYLVWLKTKAKVPKIFWFHLFLNAIWSPIFFGVKNLGLAFFVIILMDITLVIVIKRFNSIKKLAGYLLIPYLAWILFASLLNFSVWRLNSNKSINVFAQDQTFNFDKAQKDYIFAKDQYSNALFDFNSKKDSYNKNKTLSLKEELRVSLYNFIPFKNELVKTYLTMIRMKVYESNGLTQDEKANIYSKIDPEVLWFQERKNSYQADDTLEDLISKTKEEDSKYTTDTNLVIKYSLSMISLGNIIDIENSYKKIYQNQKEESDKLVSLGRADNELFKRWFSDIDQELANIDNSISKVNSEVNNIFNADSYKNIKAYEKTLEIMSPNVTNLMKLSGFIKELENTISQKR